MLFIRKRPKLKDYRPHFKGNKVSTNGIDVIAEYGKLYEEYERVLKQRMIPTPGATDFIDEEDLKQIKADRDRYKETLLAIVECTSGFGKDLDWHQVTIQAALEALNPSKRKTVSEPS